MSTWDIFTDTTFNIWRAKVAKWNGDGTYGPNYLVPSVEVVTGNGVIVSKKLEGNGKITSVASVLTEGDGNVKFGGISLDVLGIVTNQQPSLSGSTPNRIKRTKFVGGEMPYFGLTGAAFINGGLGLIQFFAPRCIITGNFMLGQASQYAYTIPDVKMEMVPDDTYGAGGVSASQTLTISATSGTFAITYNNQTTTPITASGSLSAATVQAALAALTTIGTGNVAVTGSAGGPFTIAFQGVLANSFIPALVLNTASLVGGSATIAIVSAGVTSNGCILDIIEWETAPGDIFILPGV